MEIDTLLLDCDGVLTDGGCYYGEDGSTLLRFSRVDGHGIAKLRRSGVKAWVITASDDDAILRRCADLRISLACGVTDKLAHARDVLRLDLSRCGMVGDDETDLPLMQACAYSWTPRGSWLATWLATQGWDILPLDRPGGHGAVREVCEWVMQLNGSES